LDIDAPLAAADQWPDLEAAHGRVWFSDSHRDESGTYSVWRMLS
jgi:hypothetical protein